MLKLMGFTHKQHLNTHERCRLDLPYIDMSIRQKGSISVYINNLKLSSRGSGTRKIYANFRIILYLEEHIVNIIKDLFQWQSYVLIFLSANLFTEKYGKKF